MGNGVPCLDKPSLFIATESMGTLLARPPHLLICNSVELLLTHSNSSIHVRITSLLLWHWRGQPSLFQSAANILNNQNL